MRRPTGRPFASCSRAAPTSSTHVDHRAGSFYVRINDTGRNFRLVKVDAARPDLGRAEELIAARDEVMLDDVDVFAEDLVVTERVAGSLQLRVIDLVRGGDHTVAFDEPAYTVHASGNAEFETRTLRFVYTSMTTPASTFDYHLGSRERVLRKRQPVPGYDPALYQSERIMAKAADGTEVPISLVWRRDQKTRRPAAAAALRLRQLRHPDRPGLLADAGVAARPRRGLRHRPHPRRRRPRPHLVRGRQDGQQGNHLQRLHRLRRGAGRARPDDAEASSRSRAAAPAAC